MEDAIRGFCDGVSKSDIKCCKSLCKKGNSPRGRHGSTSDTEIDLFS